MISNSGRQQDPQEDQNDAGSCADKHSGVYNLVYVLVSWAL